MNYEQLVDDLEELAQQLGLTIRYEKGDFDGGYCVLKAEKILVVNKRLHDARKASTLAVALSECGIETTYIKPTLRQYIEDEVARMARSR
jgi:hypothetical protein